MKLHSRVFLTFALFLIIYTILVFIFILPFKGFLFSIIILAAIALIITFFYIKSIIKPIEKISEEVAKISNRNYKIELPAQQKKYYDLFRNLKNISETLIKYEDKLSKRKEGFFTLIESIQQPIWIQDKKGVITVVNESFEKFVGDSKIKDHYFWNVIRQKELYDFADELFKNPKNKIKEINFENKYFICNASFLPLTADIVFILNDITEIRKLENIKKDFVLNVSHELRTPLTSIKGYIETLEDEIGDEHPTYIEVIKRNTDRLINIVKDLLTLSKLEQDLYLEKEKIELEEFLRNIKRVFEHRLKEKGLDFHYTIKDNLKDLFADRFKLEQVFINLIDNAIKYTEKGLISLNFSKENNLIKMEISDTGLGIPEEHLPRLFERFYTVDKSRSRKMGGTGLGLSIVKHIVNLHEGTIDVESKVGQGTRFTITFPIL